CLEELHDLRALDRAGEQAEVKTPVADACNDRKLLPAETILKDRSLALGGPCACATRSFGQTRLVDKDDHSALSRSDFFNSGHLLLCQLRIARSLRSRAWPVGRCTLQPSLPSNLHTDVETIETAKRSRMTCAIRGTVHSSVPKPAATAPAFKTRTSSSRCSRLSRSGRPKCADRRKPSTPPASRARSQRITVWRDTPTLRATSAW